MRQPRRLRGQFVDWDFPDCQLGNICFLSDGLFLSMPESHLVLVLEPRNADAMALESAFKEHRVQNPARVLRNAYELHSYLNGWGVYCNRELFPFPALLLIDFSDRNTAFQTLEYLRSSGQLRRLPVLGLGPQLEAQDLQLAFDLGISGYFERPADLRKVAKLICELEWTDQWKYQLSEAAQVQLLTKEQFYRMGAA